MWNMFYQRENGNIINLASIIYIDFSINRVYVDAGSNTAYSGCTIPYFFEPSKKEMNDILEQMNIEPPSEEILKKRKEYMEKPKIHPNETYIPHKQIDTLTNTGLLSNSTWSDGSPCINKNDVDPEDDRYTVFGVRREGY